MAEPFPACSILTDRLNDAWLGPDSSAFWSLFQQRLAELQDHSGSTVRVLVGDRDPVVFLSGVLAACAAQQPVFLGSAGWSSAEWNAALQCIQPDLVWSSETDIPCSPHSAPPAREPNWLDEISGAICIPTGGSSGQLRFAVHTWDTLLASVQGMQTHFQTQAIHSCCVLPLYHVSGLMQAVRSLTTGGTLAIASPKDLTSLPQRIPDPSLFFLSLVPTQLQRCLEERTLLPWLRQFRAILLGGAPAWPALLQHARQLNLPLALTYGMTETASQVATLHPNEFLAGATHAGRSLSHAQLQVVDSNGQSLGTHQTGQIQIHANSLAWGYYPGEPWRSRTLVTDDVGYLDADGNITVVGRRSDLIITGGENVYPAAVEAAILATGLVEDVCVIGLPDPVWGEAVTAVYVPKSPCYGSTLEEAIANQLRSQLSTFKRPKRWIAQAALPRNAQGKLSRIELRQQLMQMPTSSSIQ